VLSAAVRLAMVVHLTMAATWLGAMAYSLMVVQPKVALFFTDERQREDFLTTLAHGNRWRVVALIGALVVTAAGVAAVSPRRVAAGYLVALVCYLGAAAVFGNVSWRHWPARVFALAEELPRFRRSLRVQAWTILALVTAAFVSALTASVAG